MYPEFFDPIFDSGAFTEERLEVAGVKIMQVAQKDIKEARAAADMLGKMLLLALANDLVINPRNCAEAYFRVAAAALGQPTLLDQVKRQHGVK